MIGQTVSHYRIFEKLGEGGMGVVYKAQDLKLGRLVALKFLPPELTRNPEAKKRFIHEAQAASALQHNNICTVHDIDETPEGHLFIVMDFYEGETLKGRIERGALSLEDAVDIARQSARGLEHAHAQGVIHRDIKPANVLITDSHVVKIVDFGLAKLSGQTFLTKAGFTLGTAAYMSPEQARGEELDARTDIWSLGVMLYQMLSGKTPFHGEHEAALLYSIVNENIQPLTASRPDLPEKLTAIVAKMLQKDRDLRYSTMKDVAQELSALRPGGSEPRRTFLSFRDVTRPRIVVAVEWAFCDCNGLLATSRIVVSYRNSQQDVVRVFV
jgi:serine/threonine protein kinase